MLRKIELTTLVGVIDIGYIDYICGLNHAQIRRMHLGPIKSEVHSAFRLVFQEPQVDQQWVHGELLVHL